MASLKQTKEVIRLMATDFAGTKDYNVLPEPTDMDYAELLDKDDKRIAIISESMLTNYWNAVEGY